MNRILLACMITVASLAFMTACATVQHTTPLKQDVKLPASDEFTLTRQELPDEIEDLQRIPQDVRTFADAISSPLAGDEQARAVQRFRERYFSPWLATEPLSGIKQAVEGMNEFAGKTWYGENRLKVDPARIKRMLAPVAQGRIPSQNQAGIAIAPTFLRALPTSKPFYETADDFPFDQLQYSEVKPNEPVRILYVTDNGAWVFVSTAYGYGWVRSGTVVPVSEAMQQHLTDAPLLAIVVDFAIIRDEQGKALPLPRIGTLYPLVREEADNWLVNVAVSGEGDQAALKTGRISKQDARRFPLTFAAGTVAHIGNELLKTPYGWGELFRDRDCSATTRDFFIPFGIWLPRNSRQQLNSGPFVSLSNMSKADKERLLREQGVPFRTLVHRKGHIMLYIGLVGGKPVVLHNTWAVRFKTKEGREEKFYIGRTVLTTLEAGDELPLSRGTHLDHINGILTLPATKPVN